MKKIICGAVSLYMAFMCVLFVSVGAGVRWFSFNPFGINAGAWFLLLYMGFMAGLASWLYSRVALGRW